MDLSNYSIFKLKISPISKDKSGRDEYNLECIKTIDGNLLRQTITTKHKYIKIDHQYIKIDPKLKLRLFNNIKKALTYKFNNITELNYTSPVDTLFEHYMSMISYKVFGVPNLREPFNLKKLKNKIEDKIDDMIYRFLDMETYDNIKTLKELASILEKNNFILNFQCIIKPSSELHRYNIHETIWNMNVLVD